MPHDGRPLRCAGTVALVVAMACSRHDTQPEGRLVLLLPRPPASGSQLAAYPFDPASEDSSVRNGSSSAKDSAAARYLALSDSADGLDARFQRERAVLNADAVAMAGEDRRSRAYADRFDAHQRRAVAAESLRNARDKVRRSRDAALARLGGRVPERGGAASRSDRAVATGARRTPVRTAVHERVVSLALPPGSWWVRIESEGKRVARATRVVISANSTDTVRLAP